MNRKYLIISLFLTIVLVCGCVVATTEEQAKEIAGEYLKETARTNLNSIIPGSGDTIIIEIQKSDAYKESNYWYVQLNYTVTSNLEALKEHEKIFVMDYSDGKPGVVYKLAMVKIDARTRRVMDMEILD